MVLFTLASSNRKTGPIPTVISESKTCPTCCPFKSNGCYAKYGPLHWIWKRVDKGIMGIEWKEFLGKIKSLPNGQLWRWGVAGDLPGIGNTVNKTKLNELVQANRNKKGFGFSHKPVLDSQGPIAKSNRTAIQLANQNGFTINLSANNPANADDLKALQIGPIVTTVANETANVSYTPKGNKIIICPAQQKEGITCAHCKLCSNATRSVIIGFKPHGMGAKYVEKIAA